MEINDVYNHETEGILNFMTLYHEILLFYDLSRIYFKTTGT